MNSLLLAGFTALAVVDASLDGSRILAAEFDGPPSRKRWGGSTLTPAEELRNTELNDKYTRYFFIILGSFTAAVFAYRVLLYGMQYIRTITSINSDKQRYYVMPNWAYAKIKKHLLYAPLVGARLNRELRFGRINCGSIPSRLQTLTLAAWIGMNITFVVVHIAWDKPYAGGLESFLRRSGRMAVVNMIPMFLMMGRNNPLIRLLNIPFDTFNKFHRWIGRTVALLIFAHFTSWAVNKVKLEGWKEVQMALTNTGFLRAGLMTLVSVVVIFFHSPAIIRYAAYEFFLYSHIALSILMIIGLYMHLEPSPTSRKLLYFVIALWAFERASRLVSLLYRNFGPNRTTATIEVLPGDACRVTVSVARPWTFIPGQHLFLYMPSIGLWTSHPFTIAWSSEAGDGDLELDSLSNQTGKITDVSPSSEKQQPTMSSAGTAFEVYDDDVLRNRGTTFSSIIRRRGGFTSRLHAAASRSPTNTLRVTAFAEGPYGSSSTNSLLTSYGTTMLVAGGVGITHMVGYLRSLVAAHADGTTATRRILLVWIMRDPAALDWIQPWMANILALPGRRQVLRIQLFVTRPTRASEMTCSPSQTVRMFPGRPNLQTLLDLELKDRVGAMSVVCCGPGALGDEVRRCVRKRQDVGNLDLIEEGFSW
ncbi:MAG: hypothetical protein M4579_001981 [Chaenotheca gracillima]|nr:MAG: hypothetical protein M4579_001981 [Chaenotheca gracillima]